MSIHRASEHAYLTYDRDPEAQAFMNADMRGGFDGDKDSYTVSEAAWQIIRGEPGWGVLGQSYTVSYGFRASAPSRMPDDTGGFSRFNSNQIAQAELAFAGWSDVAQITFVRQGAGVAGEGAYTDSATILLGNYSSGSDGASAFGYYPGDPRPSSSSGDVWVNSTFNSNLSPVTFNYGSHVLVHEIGHTIGLAHPSEYNATSGTSNTYAYQAGYAEDDRQYTVMSYFGEFNTAGNFGGLYPAAPMLDDIAAAQMLYGANMATRLGDTVYGFNSNAGRPWFEAASTVRVVFAVWDAGGNDTFDFSGYVSNAKIDLHPGAFSSTGGLAGNIAIAIGADIENAIGGAGADTLIGSDLGNRLLGAAGSDSLTGFAGEDFMRGDLGDDYMVGGDAWDDMHGNQGSDTLWGGDGHDWVVGGQNGDLLHGEAGNDKVYGDKGADTIYGEDGDEWIRGGQDNDLVFAGAGDDSVWGDRGDDTISGGPGLDTFYAFVGVGVDRITDFSIAEGDRVRIEGGSPFNLYQAGADTVIDLGSDQIILVGVNAASLPAGSVLAI
ncbi:MAG TPA: M10 family metallopeptidase C-terminal domain-containing protein [Phenylobacterium sp.]